MAKVNLLKAEIGGISTSFVSKLPFGRLQKILLMLTGVSLLIGLLISVHTFYLKSSLKNISSEYREAEKMKKEIGVLHRQKDLLEKNIVQLSALLNRDVLWSSKLEQLRQIIPQEVWLRELSFEKRRGEGKVPTLLLTGALVPGPDMNAIATLSHFINRLKENKEFSGDFGNPALSDVRSETREKTEIMNFSIEMPLEKKGPELTDEAS
jgi:hypothetical protein